MPVVSIDWIFIRIGFVDDKLESKAMYRKHYSIYSHTLLRAPRARLSGDKKICPKTVHKGGPHMRAEGGAPIYAEQLI